MTNLQEALISVCLSHCPIMIRAQASALIFELHGPRKSSDTLSTEVLFTCMC